MQRNWGKYRIAMTNYVYDAKGKEIIYMGEGAYKRYRSCSAERFDSAVEQFIKMSNYKPA